jgi:hypothetical protein
MREQSADFVHDLVLQVVRTGLMLSDLLADLIEELPEDAYPGECAGEVVFEMLVGTIRPVGIAAGEEAVRSATALLAACSDRTLADLRQACELARDRERRSAVKALRRKRAADG